MSCGIGVVLGLTSPVQEEEATIAIGDSSLVSSATERVRTVSVTAELCDDIMMGSILILDVMSTV